MGRCRPLAASAAAVIIAACAACSSSGSPSAGERAPSSVAAASSAAPSAAPSGTPADAATRRLVAAAFSDFFGSTSTAARSQAALQHGEAFTATLEEQSKNSHADDSGATVGAVTLDGPGHGTTPNIARVTFTITGGGRPLLANVGGYAVREGGRWKVAATTFCMLLKLEGSAPAACHDPSITALPS
jgi:hypothetical protein